MTISFKVPCHMVNLVTVETTVERQGYDNPTKGNNGVGNGEDPPPPGQPPVNDGEGASPGDPGNQGGADPDSKGEPTGGQAGTGAGKKTTTSSDSRVGHDISSRGAKTDGNGYSSRIVGVTEASDTGAQLAPVIESPLFDDITVTLFKGFEVLRWVESLGSSDHSTRFAR